MNDTLKTLFLDNPELSDLAAAFCARDPEFLRAEREFYETGRRIAGLVGFALYDEFESSYNDYLSQHLRLYYLFGLGLRQEALLALTQP